MGKTSFGTVSTIMFNLLCRQMFIIVHSNWSYIRPFKGSLKYNHIRQVLTVYRLTTVCASLNLHSTIMCHALYNSFLTKIIFNITMLLVLKQVLILYTLGGSSLTYQLKSAYHNVSVIYVVVYFVFNHLRFSFYWYWLNIWVCRYFIFRFSINIISTCYKIHITTIVYSLLFFITNNINKISVSTH